MISHNRIQTGWIMGKHSSTGLDGQSGVAFVETPIDFLRDCTRDGLLGLLSLDLA